MNIETIVICWLQICNKWTYNEPSYDTYTYIYNIHMNAIYKQQQQMNTSNYMKEKPTANIFDYSWFTYGLYLLKQGIYTNFTHTHTHMDTNA